MVAKSVRPKVMGVLNVTPDSFWDGGRYTQPDQALARALIIQEEGADLLDIGAESTRPGAQPITLAEEQGRLLPVLEKVLRAVSIPVCVDTTKAKIAQDALAMGASFINDTNALEDPSMGPVVAQAGAGIVLMHRQGPSTTMQESPFYKNCVEDIKHFLKKRVTRALQAGIAHNKIYVDPGIGFGKTQEHNVEILRHLRGFSDLGFPMLLGLSRKSFLGKLLGVTPEQRLAGSLAAGIVAAIHGIAILRVHDVRETVHALKVLEAMDALKADFGAKLAC